MAIKYSNPSIPNELEIQQIIIDPQIPSMRLQVDLIQATTTEIEQPQPAPVIDENGTAIPQASVPPLVQTERKVIGTKSVSVPSADLAILMKSVPAGSTVYDVIKNACNGYLAALTF